MTELTTDDNKTITKPSEILDHTTKYYKELFEGGLEEASDHEKQLEEQMRTIMETDFEGTNMSS